MRRLDDSPWFSSPSLQQISAASADANSEQRVANAFSLTLMLDEPAREEEAN